MKKKIHFLNTIWSDSILIESQGHFALIDSGSDFYYPMIKSYLEELNIKHLDFLLLTHFHNDHYGCMIDLLNDFEFDCVYMRDYSGHSGTNANGHDAGDEYREGETNNATAIKEKAKEKSHLVMIEDGFDHLDFYDFHFDVFGSYENIRRIFEDKNSKYYHMNRFNENYDSISLFCQLEGINIYLGGDITDCDNSDYLELDHLNRKAILAIYKKYNIDKINLYKVAHHGVHDSNSKETMAFIRPDYAVITNTDRWLRNYPTISYLVDGNKDVKILRTDWQKLVFEIENKELKYHAITCDSLFDE